MQRRMLAEKTAQLQHMIEAVQAAVDGLERDVTMDDKDKLESFGEFDPAE